MSPGGIAGAPFWFADSLLHYEAVYRRESPVASHKRLSRNVIEDVTLASDMASLKSDALAERQIIDLCFTPSDLGRFMGWVRTVQ